MEPVFTAESAPIASQDLNAILQGMDEGTVNNPVVYPQMLPQGSSAYSASPVLSSTTIEMPQVQANIPRLIGAVFQRIDGLQSMLLQRINDLEARLEALSSRTGEGCQSLCSECKEKRCPGKAGFQVGNGILGSGHPVYTALPGH